MTEEPSPIVPVPLFAWSRALEAEQRAAVVAEALSWLDTPYRDGGSIKGLSGAVDCCMLLVRAWIDAGVFEPFDPRPYPPNWHMHQNRERYLEWLSLAGVEVMNWQPGDVVVWKFARTFSHSAIIINDAGDVVHAVKDFGKCTTNNMGEAWLSYSGRGKRVGPRPRKFFDAWALFRKVQV
jgi:cell wall-associated NlpC family hydrolase